MTTPEKQHKGQKALILAAIIAGFFTLAVLTGLGLFYEANKDRVIRVSGITALKEKLEKDPMNEALKNEIREADRIDRAAYFGMLDLLERGKYPLAAFFVLFVLFLKFYLNLNPSLPGKKSAAPPAEGKYRYKAVLSMSIVFFVLCAGMLSSAFFDASKYMLALKPKPAEMPVEPVESVKLPDEKPAAPELIPAWPGFRGKDGLGVAAPNPVPYPVKFDYKTGENIKWKSALTISGYASPVICGNDLLLWGEANGNMKLQCFDIETGALKWEKEAAPKAKKTEQIMSEKDGGAGMAASTPSCDGKYIYAFSPMADVYCFDMKGKQVWTVDLGSPDSVYGLATSPLLFNDRIILQVDKLKDGAALIALNKKDGKQAWKIKRKVQSSWSTPSIADLNGTKCIITFADPDAIAYTADGTEIWRTPVVNGDMSASPLTYGGTTYVASNMSLYALDAGGKQLWEAEKDTTINSPVTDGKKLVLAQAGNIAVYNLADGKLVFKQDAKSDFWASPVLSGETCYAAGLDGRWYIFKLSDKYEPIAEFDTGEKTAASPAFVGGKIYVRTEKNLYCVGK